jgi:hypothetical protein
MKKLILIGLICYSFSTAAQDDPQKIIDQFFTLYKSKGVVDAVDYVFSTNKWMGDSKDQIENVKFKLNGTVKQLGDYYGYSLITKKTLGSNISHYTFLIRHDRQPLRFTFLFYNPDKEWRLQNFSYDYNIAEELEEAAKSYRLKENLNVEN